MKWTDSRGNVRELSKIETQADIDRICRCGYFGNGIKIGDYAEYLGPSDGGYAVYDAAEIENKDIDDDYEM